MERMKIGILIACRVESERLPKKALELINGKTTIEILIERVKHCNDIDEIMLCTTPNETDEILIEIAIRESINFFKGDADNVMKRLVDAAHHFELDFIISIDGDDILTEPYYIEQIANVARKGIYDMIATEGLPLGLNVIGCTPKALKKVMNLGKDTGWHEFFIHDRTMNKAYISPLKEHLIHGRFTLDYEEDLTFFKAIFAQFSHETSLDFIIPYLKENPCLLELNQDRNHEYWETYYQKIKSQYKILIVGLGSMGKRRINNLLELGYVNLLGFDQQESRRREVLIPTSETLEEALNLKPDMMIICVPPLDHFKVQEIAAKNGIPSFCEASVIKLHVKDLIALSKEKKVMIFPSATLRFHPGIKKIKALLDDNVIGEVLTFTHESSSQLEDWHPYEKWFYAHEKEQGATREIVPFELAWLTWLFGNVDVTRSIIINHASTTIDDIYNMLLEFESGITGQLLVSTISQYHHRYCRIIGTKGVITWDWSAEKVRLIKRVDSNHCIEQTFDYGEQSFLEDKNVNEQMYVDEINHFINSVLRKEEYHYSLEDDLNILRTLHQIEHEAIKMKRGQ